ncbi:SIMPL domain-containing protein [Shewanella ulleungensis]|uniref:Oxidative stress defense protein n=1 Tax=Shewanella ulleungensis TaxID=2282699 RepID=A0ABQ2QIW5_9GAMM|nr:SIMPL domain-containing protein [Shewanella ulleungensis]MCL1151880.1 SIMPL domain-containing protein [Shewanella ulleungensis]GGP83737.1 oxidative stress defense protein [Shewanella ulleungensis]
MKIFMGMFLIAFSLSCLANSSLPPNRHVAVQGKAKLTAIPDIATLKFEVRNIDKNALNAKQKVDEIVNGLLNGLHKFSIKEQAVTASNLLTEPHIRYGDNDEEVIDGFVATRTINLIVSDLNLLNDVINFALSVGINEIEDIQMSSSQIEQLMEKANQLAVQNAKEKGASLAKAFGATLGDIYSINSNNNSAGYNYVSHYGLERITVTGSRVDPDDLTPGRYLQASMSVAANIDVVFDLIVEK